MRRSATTNRDRRNGWGWTRGVCLGLAVGLATAAAVGTGGCAEDCGPYVECTTAVGLRWVDCGVVHRFNDGDDLKSEQAAYAKCFCAFTGEPCADGRTLDVCFSAHYDGREGGFFSDGTVVDAGDAFAQCRGFDTCTVVRDVCDAPYYFLECTAGSEVAWVGSDGTVHPSREAAEAGCRIPGSTCRSAVGSCAEVGACGPQSRACWAPVGSDRDCSTFPRCDVHDDAYSCDDDPACTWEGT